VVPAPPGGDPPLAWLLEMFERVGGKKAHAARVAGNNLNEIVLNSISYTLSLASRGKNSIAKQWAGQLLASIFVTIEKHHKKLIKTNAAYLKEKKRLGKLRINVLFPKSSTSKTVQGELKKAESHRKRLLLLKGTSGGRWKTVAGKRRIPKKYFVTVDLPEFSVKSEPQWWEFLWPLIRKKINIPKLDLRYKMARKRYASDSEKTARDHLKLLARRSDEGVLL
jgi:hypothetical protein